jgi:hypothetical protein
MSRSGMAGWAGRSWVEGNKHSSKDKKLSVRQKKHMPVIRRASSVSSDSEPWDDAKLTPSGCPQPGKEPVYVDMYVDTSIP